MKQGLYLSKGEIDALYKYPYLLKLNKMFY